MLEHVIKRINKRKILERVIRIWHTEDSEKLEIISWKVNGSLKANMYD
jgi:hypothetical protein